MPEATDKNGMWRTGQSSWMNGSRQSKATAAAVVAQEFIDSGIEISDRIFRDGPWPTAIRLQRPFTGGNSATEVQQGT